MSVSKKENYNGNHKSNRISFGGDRAISQRICYINTKELTGGTIRAENVPLRYKDPVTGFDMDGSYI